MKKFYCEKLMFVVNSYTAGVFNKHCLLTLFSFFYNILATSLTKQYSGKKITCNL